MAESSMEQRDGPDAMSRRIAELRKQLAELRLRQRAGEPTAAGLLQGRAQLLVCEIDGHHCGLPAEHIDEVVLVAALTPFPEAPLWVAGLLDMRGTTVPVVDVAARISGKKRKPALSESIVLCRVNGSTYGLIVQEVSGVYRSDAEPLKPPDTDIPHAPYLLGTLYLDRQPTLVLSTLRLVDGVGLPEGQP